METWHTVAVIAAVALVAWWVWTHPARERPGVMLERNTPAPVAPPPPGIPPTLVAKMARAADTSIPVVMTSGSAVQYGDDEVKQVVRQVLARLNDMGENVSLIQVASASKTVDSYKTVAYDLVVSVHDHRENVGLLVAMSVLVPVSGKLFLRSMGLYSKASERDPGPPGAGAIPGGGHATYEDPVTVLNKMRLGGPM